MKPNKKRCRRVRLAGGGGSIGLLLLIFFTYSGLLSSSDNPHGELEMDCEECHTTASWTEVRYTHGETGFVLNDSHAGLPCEKCHDIGDFSAAGRECRGCHPDVHESKLGPDCERCHTPRRWEIFDNEEIHARTSFPLLGKHVLIDCRSCHADLLEGDYAVSVRDCIDCHEEDYLSTGNPGHIALGIGTICSDCHEPIRWRPAYFPIHDTLFPIFSGEHNGAWSECGDCHPDPSTFSVFSCFKCHSRSRTDNNHEGVQGYRYDSQACLGCHPNGSKGGGISAVHDSNYFPIFAGTHASVWESCSQCHPSPDDYSSFSCLGCHEHEQSLMDTRHAGISGYGYDSAQCLSCHPTGEAGDFLDHDQLYFPIYSGAHNNTWDDCTICHTDPNNRSVFSCLDCHEHERAEMDDEHSDVGGYSYDSQACFDCHPRGQEMIRWRKPRLKR